MQRHMTMSQKVLEGAASGASNAHKTAHQLHSLQRALTQVKEIKSEASKKEDFTRANSAKLAEAKLEHLVAEGEKLVLAKVEALSAEDYEAAHQVKTKMDSVMAETEELLSGLRQGATQAAAAVVTIEATEEEAPDVESPVMVASHPAARAASEAQLVD